MVDTEGTEEGSSALTHGEVDELLDGDAPLRRGVPTSLLLVLFSGALATAWVLSGPKQANPRAVRIAATGCAMACEENLARTAALILETQGFSLGNRSGEDVEDAAALTTLATEADAAHWLFIELGRAETLTDAIAVPLTVTLGSRRAQSLSDATFASPAYETTRFETTIAVADPFVDPSSEDPPPTEEDARMQGGLQGMDALMAGVVPALLGDPSVTQVIEGEPDGTMSEIASHAILVEAQRGAEDQRVNARALRQECRAIDAEIHPEGDQATCVSRGCERVRLVDITADGLVIQDESRPVAYPIGQRHGVVTVPQAVALRRVAFDSPILTDTDRDTRAIAPPKALGERAIGTLLAGAHSFAGYGTADPEGVAFVSASTGQFHLHRQRFLEADSASPSDGWLATPLPAYTLRATARGPWVLFEEYAFDGSEPVLKALRDGGSPIEPTPFGLAAEWLPLRSRGDRVVWAAVLVAGIQEEMLAALETQRTAPFDDTRVANTGAASATDANAADTSTETTGETEAIDDLDIDPAAEARLATGLPPREHLALISLPLSEEAGAEDHTPTLIARIGGWSEPISFARATPDGRLFLMRARRGACAFALLEVDSLLDAGALDATSGPSFEEAIPWQPLPLCPRSVAVSDTSLYGTALTTEAQDPSPTDTEVVRFSLDSGEMTQLTHNAIDEQRIRVLQREGEVQLAFERVPVPRTAGVEPRSVCTLRAP